LTGKRAIGPSLSAQTLLLLLYVAKPDFSSYFANRDGSFFVKGLIVIAFWGGRLALLLSIASFLSVVAKKSINLKFNEEVLRCRTCGDQLGTDQVPADARLPFICPKCGNVSTWAIQKKKAPWQERRGLALPYVLRGPKLDPDLKQAWLILRYPEQYGGGDATQWARQVLERYAAASAAGSRPDDGAAGGSSSG
jgi:predicted RNA-binding Zn-ribbon protein involved in translation (DUF1610 family)